MGKYIGIDLGTTFSVAAYIDSDGKPQVIQNEDGNYITPSAVLFDGDTAIVGEEAIRCSITNKNSFVAFAKRDMGRRNKKYRINGTEYTPEEISARVLKKIRLDVEKALDDKVDGAVITVPAYFTEPQRVATMDAATIAGISVLEIINEPTAAALAYAYGSKKGKTQVFLVYDLGGGTFDLSLCKVDGEEIEVLCSNGNHELGGYDFDNEIIKWFTQKANAEGVDISQDLEAQQELMIRAEEVKKALSKRSKAALTVTIQGKRIQAELTREEFNDMIEPLIYQTISLLNATLDEAGVDISQLDKILLVGGSTRIPMVKNMILDETEITPSEELHPDEVVAIGAAYHAVNCANKKPTPQFDHQTSEKPVLVPDEPTDIPQIKEKYTFIDRTTHGIGVVTWNEEKEIYENTIVLPKNSVMPAEAAQQFETIADYATSLSIKITEGEETDMRYTTVIGNSDLQLRPKPAHSPIKVIISCDTNSIIHIRVYDIEDQVDLGEMRIERSNNMTKEDVMEASKKIGKMNIGWEE